ncbi:MAG: sigma 54-interacting transcriptional regulator [Myxococcota bacterium]
MKSSLAPHATRTSSEEEPSSIGLLSAAGLRPERWCLTLLYHPEVARIGAQFCWPSTLREEVGISRLSPLFSNPDASPPRPLADSRLSRSALKIRCTERGLELEPEDERVRFEIDGRPGSRLQVLSTSRAAAGVVLTLGRRVSMMIHAAREEGFRPERLGLLGVSAALQRVWTEARLVSPLELPVLLTGESGVGKELVAQAIHRLSPRAGRPFVAVNMSEMVASMALSELFGHDRGAFTGAATRRPGLFDQAEGGTLFLDEIGETATEIQPMLMRAIDAGEIRPLGIPSRPVNVRIIAATDANLQQLTSVGQFRNALLHRLSAVTLAIPPLRERLVDIPLLLVHFLREALRQLNAERLLEAPAGERSERLKRSDVLTLLRYPWPGNIRELRNVAFQIALSANARETTVLPSWLLDNVARLDSANEPPVTEGRAGPDILSPDVSRDVEKSAASGAKPARIDSTRLRATLEGCGWRIGEAAASLGITRKSLYAWMDEAGIAHAGLLSREVILEVAHAVGDIEPERLAPRLQVSPRGLRLRMRQLGLLS